MDIFLQLLLASYTFSYAEKERTLTQSETAIEFDLQENTEYCQMVYWYPNARKLLENANCDIESTEREIQKVKRG